VGSRGPVCQRVDSCLSGGVELFEVLGLETEERTEMKC